MFKTIVSIGLGGACGAIARHFFNNGITMLVKTSFPWGIMAANILGSFIMGALIAAFAGFWNPSQEMRLFLTVGFLGAFTTFSTFSLDTMTLWTRGDMVGAASYILASVTLSIAGIFLGSWMVWKFMP